MPNGKNHARLTFVCSRCVHVFVFSAVSTQPTTPNVEPVFVEETCLQREIEHSKIQTNRDTSKLHAIVTKREIYVSQRSSTSLSVCRSGGRVSRTSITGCEGIGIGNGTSEYTRYRWGTQLLVAFHLLGLGYQGPCAFYAN